MAAENAKIVDFQAYRDARRKPAAPVAALPTGQAFSGLQPMMVWVPVWTFVPMMPSPWIHAQ